MDITINHQLFAYVLAPLIASQLFFTILIYFIIVRKHIASDYKLYIVFLSTYIVFLLGRIGWVFSNNSLAFIILYVRMALLMGIGIPSLLIATAKQSGIEKTKALSVFSYGSGILLSIAYILFFDAYTKEWFITARFLEKIHIQNPLNYAHYTQITAAFTQLIIPCSWLIVKEIYNKKDPKLLAFLFGALFFGLALYFGLIAEPQNFGLLYIGSIPTGILWFWAVFKNIRDLKGKVTFVKEELQIMVRSGIGTKTNEIKTLLQNLESLSQGNSDVYKMRIREILNMLTDTIITAGGDTQTLIKRNIERGNAIEQSSNTHQIQKIIYKEAIELSEMMQELPTKNTIAIQKATSYIKENYAIDISVDNVATFVGLSKAHLMREFKKAHQLTLNQYLTNLRITEAKKRLPTQSVSETAYAVGYNNPNYFSTVFKKNTGFSPIEYQESSKKEF